MTGLIRLIFVSSAKKSGSGCLSKNPGKLNFAPFFNDIKYEKQRSRNFILINTGIIKFTNIVSAVAERCGGWKGVEPLPKAGKA